MCIPAPTGPLWELDLQRTLSSPVAELFRLLVTWFAAREIQYQDVELQTGYGSAWPLALCSPTALGIRYDMIRYDICA